MRINCSSFINNKPLLKKTEKNKKLDPSDINYIITAIPVGSINFEKKLNPRSDSTLSIILLEGFIYKIFLIFPL